MGSRDERINLIISAKNQAKGSLDGIKNQIIGIGAAYLTWSGAKNAISAIVKSGMEAEKVWNDLSVAVQQHGESWKKVEPTLISFTKRLQNLTGQSDELIASGLQRLISYGMSTGDAMKYIVNSMDLAVKRSLDLTTATDLVGKAYVGYTATLSKYGIMLDESLSKTEKFQGAMAQLSKFSGAAESRMNTLTGVLDLLGNTWDDFLEEIYKTTDTGRIIASFAASIISALQSIPETFNSFIESLRAWGRHVIITIGVVVDIFKAAADAIKNFFKLNWADFAAGVYDLSTKTASAMIVFETSLKNAFSATGNWINNAFSLYSDAFKAMTDMWGKFKPGEVGGNIAPQLEQNKIELAGYSEDYKRLVDNWMDYERGLQEESYYDWVAQQEEKLATAQQFQDDMSAITMSGVNTMIDQLWDGEIQMKSIFSNMAKDFTKYFINKALADLAGGFVVKLLGILGSIFDTRKNDMMAAKQGSDYAKFFTLGMSDYLGKANLAGRISGLSPAIAGGSSGGNMTGNVVNNYYFQGITDEQYVNRKVIPAIERASSMGRTNIATTEKNMTGVTNVNLR